MLPTIKTRLKHRDTNWLSFNERVLQEAEDKINPLYERIKFLAIFSSNLDEFFRVRVSQLRQMKRVDKSIRKKLALHPNKISKEILGKVKLQQQKFGMIYYDQIIPELAANGINLVDSDHFSSGQRKFATKFFNTKITSFLEIKEIDLSKDSDLFLENNKLYLIIAFKGTNKLGILNIPSDECGRFIQLENNEITFLDDIIRNEIPNLFRKEEVSGVYEIKLSRDAELYIEEEFEGILAEQIYNSLGQRSEGQATRLLYACRL